MVDPHISQAPPGNPDYDIIVIGGGFYGCALALLFRSLDQRVLILERGKTLMERASSVNQARVHSGFHYPRHFSTARQSAANSPRFAELFEECIYDEFEMLYAIARRKSRVSANRFESMFQAMGVPISPAPLIHQSLFDSRTIEAVFSCPEFAFDWKKLRTHLRTRLSAHGVELRLEQDVHSLKPRQNGAIEVELESGETLTTGDVFNVTYSQINHVLKNSGLAIYPLKHELTEVALVSPPADLGELGITVMDGPFFSIMPFPAEKTFSLTHVRYTPQASWTDEEQSESAYRIAEDLDPKTRWRHMAKDAARYLPCMSDVTWDRSLFEVKTVLLKNEVDDGRPIMLNEHAQLPGLFTVLGGKFDNIFDLFEILKKTRSSWSRLSTICLERL